MLPEVLMVGFFVVGVPLSASPAQAKDSAAVVRYDEFMVRPERERIGVFNEVSPENKAELVRTHLERWIQGNAPRLSGEQRGVMERNLAFVTAARYRQPKKSEGDDAIKALMERSAKLFTAEELRQALTIHGDYIPPANAE